jgi:hypothetical protein
MTELSITIIRDEESNLEQAPPPSLRTRFIVQTFVSLLVVAGCVVGLVLSGEAYSRNDVFLTILASVVGLYLPSPKPR